MKLLIDSAIMEKGVKHDHFTITIKSRITNLFQITHNRRDRMLMVSPKIPLNPETGNWPWFSISMVADL